MDWYEQREQHRKQFGFVRVSPEIAASLKPYCLGRVVEVMSGTGHLAAGLRAAGVTLRATDNFSWHKKCGWEKTWTDVDPVDAVEAAQDADTVIMVWPYMDPVAYRAAMAMKLGASLLYCGEGQGGCTASDEFFNLVGMWTVDEKFADAVNKYHESWEGLHDRWERFTKTT
jgi:hypothetical protein